MKKDEYTIFVELKRLPKNCADCPMFSISEYRCHNERGDQGNCKMGYMQGADMRDFTGKSLYSGCRLLMDERVRFYNLDCNKLQQNATKSDLTQIVNK